MKTVSSSINIMNLILFIASFLSSHNINVHYIIATGSDIISIHFSVVMIGSVP